ncbi:hypothetical protein QF027_001305 [Streptomyces canus]|nr:hypothetical protein [Streptomyces canus]
MRRGAGALTCGQVSSSSTGGMGGGSRNGRGDNQNGGGDSSSAMRSPIRTVGAAGRGSAPAGTASRSPRAAGRRLCGRRARPGRRTGLAANSRRGRSVLGGQRALARRCRPWRPAGRVRLVDRPGLARPGVLGGRRSRLDLSLRQVPGFRPRPVLRWLRPYRWLRPVQAVPWAQSLPPDRAAQSLTRQARHGSPADPRPVFHPSPAPAGPAHPGRRSTRAGRGRGLAW